MKNAYANKLLLKKQIKQEIQATLDENTKETAEFIIAAFITSMDDRGLSHNTIRWVIEHTNSLFKSMLDDPTFKISEVLEAAEEIIPDFRKSI